MSDEQHHRKLERMYLSAPINQFYKPTIRVSDGQAEISISARRELFHAAGAVHGSVYFKLMDDTAFFAVSSLVEDVFALTVSFNVYLTRPIVEGLMTATGRVVHQSKRLFLAESQVTNSQGQEIARGSGSFMKSNMHLSSEIGYR